MSRQADWLNAKFAVLRAQYGNKCYDCGSTENLEFSHVQPTSLRGRGRGKYQRYMDIVRNPTCFRLRCRECHSHFDGF